MIQAKEPNVIELKRHLCKKNQFGHGPYLVDERAYQVECGTCGLMLNPIDVLINLYRHGERLKWQYERL